VVLFSLKTMRQNAKGSGEEYIVVVVEGQGGISH